MSSFGSHVVISSCLPGHHLKLIPNPTNHSQYTRCPLFRVVPLYPCQRRLSPQGSLFPLPRTQNWNILVVLQTQVHLPLSPTTQILPQVEKLSIIPRSGGALGFTFTPPKTEDRALMFDNEIRGRLAMLMGGRAAEELTCSHLSTGMGCARQS